MTRQFWVRSLERAVKTAVQAYVAAWGVFLHDFDHIADEESLKLAGAAALLSFLTSAMSGPVGPDESPSLVG